ncbi:Elongation factor G-like protein [Methylocella tundrae]|uniref:Elongation factor G n=1 Tax=Methylocella tundrae TaxID=227605 RepID=A0A8B6M663_METTU|nr:elongation factor G [Methylocella tundrae]VTZ25384.1 Elongation factor G-like protein [Methylocella tundrae]VTZ50318.1 Elongation factor G-like protein [Methylocella tundrae]
MTGSVPKAAAGPRSIALIGPQGAGKSTLFDALLLAAGAPAKRQTDVRGRPGSEARLGHCAFLGERWSILDCAGSVEFAFETSAALMAVDLAVVVCEPTTERISNLPLLLKSLEEHNLPHLIFINKIDTLAGSFQDAIAALQTHSTRPLLARQLPIRAGDAVIGYIDVVTGRAYRYGEKQSVEPIELPPQMREPEKQALTGLTETLADQDDALMEKLLEDVTPTPEELYQHLRKDQAKGSIVEVLIGAASRGHGVYRLWKALRHDVPTAIETAQRRGVPAGDQPAVQIFKTVQAGKLCYGRVWRGALRDGATLDGVRVGGIYRFAGAESVRAPEADAGELVALGRLDGVATGAFLGGAQMEPFPEPPPPVYELAVTTKDRKDDVKLSAALQKLVQDDPSLSIEHRPETGETVLRGQGEIHLNAAIERLSSVYNVLVTVSAPKIAYKETIRRAVSQHGRVKRQTGGHGQFADVKLEVEPRPRGAGFLFTDKIVGGSVPRNYIPAVREAAEEAMQKGPLGYPVVDVGVTLVDGGFHAVDSSDMAFRTATRIAIAEALAKAEPVLLEPVDHVTVSVPNAFTAAAQRLLSGRRGQIMGYTEKPGWPGWDDVEALAPAAELHDFIMDLRSDTMGLGAYRRRFDHLSEARR